MFSRDNDGNPKGATRLIKSVYNKALHEDNRWPLHEDTVQKTPNITVTRRANLLALHQKFLEDSIAAGLAAKGLEKLFAEKIQTSASMLSQIKSSRPIGDALARQIERRLAQNDGWLDAEHEYTIADPGEEAFIAMARNAWRSANAKQKKELKFIVKNLGSANSKSVD